MKEDLRAGLSRVLTDVPLGHGYVDAMLGVTTEDGPFARVEAGLHPLSNLGLFGFGEANEHGAQAGIGARLTF